MPEDIVVGQIGCGYWGPNLLRNFVRAPGCQVKWVAEQSEERRDYVAGHYPETSVTGDAGDVIGDAEVDAVIIATPAGSHYALASSALEAGKHVLVEKPLALDLADAERLVSMTEERGLVLMVGHTYLYNDALSVLARQIDEGVIGDIYYFDLKRLNLGIARTDVNAWWNLAPHDISILLRLRGGRLPSEVSATGASFIQKGIEDTVFARLNWDDGVIAHIHVSWLSPDKVRHMTVVGSRKMAVFDELAAHPVSVYDKGIELMPAEAGRRDYDDFTGTQLVHRVGEVAHPDVTPSEPLAGEVGDFLACIANGGTPIADARRGRDVVAVLAAGDRSLKANGAPVKPEAGKALSKNARN